jgi:RHS repeat-associated protein
MSYRHGPVSVDDGVNDTPLVTYTRGRDLSGTMQGAGGIGGLLARTDNGLLAIGNSGAHAYYHADGNGNVTALVDASQIVVARYLYDPFGRVLSLSGPLADANVYRFSSKELHPNSGLVYYLYRFYDPNLQRWANRDPLGEKGGLNLYAFTHNRPANTGDAWGLQGPLSDANCDTEGHFPRRGPPTEPGGEGGNDHDVDASDDLFIQYVDWMAEQLGVGFSALLNWLLNPGPPQPPTPPDTSPCPINAPPVTATVCLPRPPRPFPQPPVCWNCNVNAPPVLQP